MFRNHLLIFWRSIRRQPLFTFLNLSGLTVGIAALLFILLYIDFELNFDRFHEKKAQVFRIETNKINTRNKVIDVEWQTTSANLLPLVKQDYSELLDYARIYEFYSNEAVELQYGDKTFEEEAIAVADSSLLNLFSYKLKSGNPQEALKGPNKIIISEQLAERIFPGQNPLGQTLETQLVHNITSEEEAYALTVSGVFKNTPRNTHLLNEAYISAETDPELNNYYFNRFNVYSYVLLKENIDPTAFAPKLTTIYDNYLDPEIEAVLVNATHELVPLTAIHLRATGGMTYIYVFAMVGLLLLLIAGISYVNMVTAQASRRALEIGVRKVMGSGRGQLISQFLSESLLFTLLGISGAVILVGSTIKKLNLLFELQLSTAQLWQPQLILGLFTIVFLLGMLGGSYPAFFLSSFKPIHVLKGQSIQKAPLQRSLILVQFAAVLFVLACTSMIYDQLKFISEKDLGFEQDEMVRITLSGNEEIERATVLKEVLLNNPNITAAATSSFTTGLYGMFRRPVSAKGTAGTEPQFSRHGHIDYDYLETMDIKLLEGRNFSPDFPGDQQNSIILNQAAIKNFGLESPIIGQEIRWGDAGNPNFYTVIGVVEDIHQGTLHNSIESQFFTFRPEAQQLNIKIEKDVEAGLTQIKNSLAAILPNKDFDFVFLDELLQEAYEADQRRGKLFFYFSLLTIFIAFLGLFGLASYLAKRRTREIGIRKVLGAELGHILILMTKNFVWLVVIAALPAFLIAWYVIDKWLENFAFRVETNYWLLGMVLLFTILLTFFTTGFHALKAASLSPAKTLKDL